MESAPTWNFDRVKMVGPDGLEPSTPRLSSACSNQLSYEPAIGTGRVLIEKVDWWSRTVSNRRPPACKAGALPTELRPRLRFFSSKEHL
jgi:hypothetical protein